MKCTPRVKRECPFAHRCGALTTTHVAIDSECADFIMSVMFSEDDPEAVEAEYLRQERQAIQEEGKHVEY